MAPPWIEVEEGIVSHVTYRSPENPQSLQVHADLLPNQVKALPSMLVIAPGELAH